MKKILFLCGSPRGSSSDSLAVAKYMSLFLDYDYEFVDVIKAKLSIDTKEAEPSFLEIVRKIKEFDVIIWTFGVYALFVPVQMHYLLAKLINQGYYFNDKIVASIVSSLHIGDDLALNSIRFISERLGFGYIGDISTEGDPIFGYINEEETEDSCRVLANKINRALEENYIPAKENVFFNQNIFPPSGSRKSFEINSTEAEKTGDKTILIISSYNISQDAFVESIVKSINKCSQNKVEVVDLEKYDIKPCKGCYRCFMGIAGNCILKDDFPEIESKIRKSEGIVLICDGSLGVFDIHIKNFLERIIVLFHRPSLKDKYGFVIVDRGGFRGKDIGESLKMLINRIGISCIAVLYNNGNDESSFANTLYITIRDLDQAMEQKWKVERRFSDYGLNLAIREWVAKYGFMVQAEYAFFKRNNLLDYPRMGLAARFLRYLYKNKKILTKLIVYKRIKFLKAREQRIENLFKKEALGKGRNIGGG